MIFIKTQILTNSSADLVCAAQLIRQGELVAFPTETVYGLGANALDALAVQKIFAAKGRPADNPLIIHIAQVADYASFAREINPKAQALIDNFCPGPLTLVLPKATGLPDNVTAGLDSVAIRMPSLPVAQQLIELAGVPIAAPSANTSGRPSPTCGTDVLEDLQNKIAAIIMADSSAIGLESTVVDCTTMQPKLLRPGGITLAMLEEIVGAVEVDASIQTFVAVATPKSPGMKYKHYAPQAKMSIWEELTNAEIIEFIRANLAHKPEVGLLLSAEVAEKLGAVACQVQVWGKLSETEKLAAQLYAVLRQFDRAQVSEIYAQGVPVTGLGLAIMNRMRKSAAFNIIKKI